mmetsp:Transcript_29085/g.34584  ORF Transcript_29085/g.34584 Transcript_29085/m.34584 type:complete len:101 (+) Transcript_29085:53-355(+)
MIRLNKRAISNTPLLTVAALLVVVVASPTSAFQCPSPNVSFGRYDTTVIGSPLMVPIIVTSDRSRTVILDRSVSLGSSFYNDFEDFDNGDDDDDDDDRRQ